MNTKNNEVVNDLLGYEGLKIIQRPDMFNFSLDSTILAYYVSINKTTKKIIDLGCGNGYIPIFLSLRTKALIHGVEIQEESFDLATRSVEINNLEEQIKIYLGDMKQIHKQLGVAQYDVVTSNPPYFIYKEESLINSNDYLTIARHEVKVTLDEVVHSANILLKDGGTFAMVHRVERLMDILEAFRKHSIEPKRLLFVYPKTTSEEALVVFIEGKKSNKKGGLKILPPLYVYNEENKYTDEILKIFNYKKED
ncbi:MAG: tRNA1(Val) (adenine(37)-N6)-methyltransferase [Bacilli bacterium]|nr:tRNA1(Val) (adenine(37)-N6)-methyltransferase [Bacilli bacterium]